MLRLIPVAVWPWRGKRGCIDPVSCVLIRRLRITHHIRQSRAGKSELLKRIGRVLNREQRQAAGQADNSGKLPVSQNLSNYSWCVASPMLASAIRQLIYKRSGETLWHIVRA